MFDVFSGRGINMGDGWETARKLTRPAILEPDSNGLIKVRAVAGLGGEEAGWWDGSALRQREGVGFTGVQCLRADWATACVRTQVPGSDWAVLKLGTTGVIEVSSCSAPQGLHLIP